MKLVVEVKEISIPNQNFYNSDEYPGNGMYAPEQDLSNYYFVEGQSVYSLPRILFKDAETTLFSKEVLHKSGNSSEKDMIPTETMLKTLAVVQNPQLILGLLNGAKDA